jgi:flavin reductase (DIM6/NTAB) family NADH-FMN oxidoreductase RutF
MHFDPAVTMRPPPLKHNPYTALVMPRPIGWVSTIGKDGIVNLAPYSFFNAVAGDPPCVMFCANGRNRHDGGEKDSLRNVREVPEFVWNLCTYDLREEMNATSEHFPHGVDEMAKAGLAPAPSVKIRPPRVARSKVALECVVYRIVDLPPTRDGATNNMVIGRVVCVHIADEAIVDGKIEVLKLKPMARLGYFDYAVIDDFITLLRPD